MIVVDRLGCTPPRTCGYAGSVNPLHRGLALRRSATTSGMRRGRCELDVLSDAWNTGAPPRARAAGRGGPAGGRRRRRRACTCIAATTTSASGTIEYVVTGTAIRLPGSTAATCPTLTDLSVQDYWRLHERRPRAGRLGGHDRRRVRLAAADDAPATAADDGRPNQELDELSQRVPASRVRRSATRSRARWPTRAARARSGSSSRTRSTGTSWRWPPRCRSPTRRGWQRGRLGLPYCVSGHGDVERRGWVITMHAAGTAVRRRAGPSPSTVKTAIRMGATVTEYDARIARGHPRVRPRAAGAEP